MKRRRIMIAACGLAGLLSFGWLLLVSSHDSTEAAKIQEAAIALHHGNEEARSSGRKTLEEMGPRATALLAQQARRQEGILLKFRRKISPLFPRSWRARISRLLPARDPFTEKLTALQVLRLLGTNAAAAVPAMEAALSDPMTPVAWEAAAALANAGEAGLPPLIRSLQNPTNSVRQAAVHGLSLTGSNAAPAVPELITLLSDQNIPVRFAVQDTLLRVGAPAVESLARASLAADEHVRTGAVHVLHIAQCDTRPAVTILTQACGTNEPVVRRYAARALGQVRAWETNSVLALARLLNDPEELVRLEATRSLKQSGLRAALALPQLTTLLQDSTPAIREAAVETLARLGGLARPALPELERCLNDPAESVRIAASNGIVAIQATAPPPGSR